MKTVNIYSASVPGTFALSGTEDNYNTEKLSYEISTMLYNASQSGMSISVAEETDLETFASSWDEWASDMKSNMAAAEGENAGAMLVPALPAIGALALWLAKGAGAYMLAKIITTVIDVGAEVIKRKALNKYNMSLDDIVRKAFLRKEDNQDQSIPADTAEAIANLECIADLGENLRVWVQSGYAGMRP